MKKTTAKHKQFNLLTTSNKLNNSVTVCNQHSSNLNNRQNNITAKYSKFVNTVKMLMLQY